MASTVSRHRDRGSSHRTRDPTATPSHTRSSRPAAPPLPPYQHPVAPLNEEGQHALTTLVDSRRMRTLKTHIQHAAEKLTDAAGEINERLTEAKVRHENLKQQGQRRRDHAAKKAEPGADGDDDAQEADEEQQQEGQDGDSEEARKLAEVEQQVAATTKKIEQRMRSLIDAENVLDSLRGVVVKVKEDCAEEFRAANHRERQQQEEEEEQEGDEQRNEPEVYTGKPPSQRVDEMIKDEKVRWEKLSFKDRYSTHNAYIGFYRMVHESKYPADEAPPVPHSSTWFSHLDQPSTDPSTNAPDDDDTTRRPVAPSASASFDDEVAIARERLSLKCPITQMTFTDPVTSTKCPHSFERQAILAMINRGCATAVAPPGSKHQRVKAVECPVAGCNRMLTAEDLKTDVFLLRRVKRAEAAEQREAEYELEADGVGRRRKKGGRKSGFTVASDEDGEEEDGEEVDNDDEEDDDDAHQARARQRQRPHVKEEFRSVDS